jgi:hypothetical protein
MVKEILKRVINNYLWSKWVDVDTFYNDYTCWLIQMKINYNGKRVFRTVKISGSKWAYRWCKPIALERIQIVELDPKVN